MNTLTAEVRIPEISVTHTFTFTVSDGKVSPQSKGTFVDQADGQVVLGFGIKIEKERLR